MRKNYRLPWRVLGKFIILLPLLIPLIARPAPKELTACSDPGLIPLFDMQGRGIYNKIEELIASYYGQKIGRYFFPMQMGFIRHTLVEKACHFVVGVPAGYELTLNTKPLFRSTYVLVYRSDSGFDIKGIDDPILSRLKIGGIVNNPAFFYLKDEGITNYVGYNSFYDSFNRPDDNPNLQIIKDLLDKKIDVAVLWGPIAGYFVKEYNGKLKMILPNPKSQSDVRLDYKVAIGVRKGDTLMKEYVEKAILEQKEAIKSLLVSNNVPLLPCDNCVINP
ncbi:extracellular solute-binding protein family 3 [Hydrogenobacter thermophilus TK-6]|uniref:Extracellular solute-binding protein, family 3 n=1 Tax=Hydrogenobacter thermophilus (strain DSM 6534 / IAM 12695 / TK-6) TaxID=608538 RepID=D3DGA3_HYDTT|nr:transporter substrate-binding domain-containing protein [Hydrogenobacter thermophilus]ADO44790.1 extracellular solute-binding protein family 3 [Hydrogenobacter thermophilus TK-6]BAI68855.1 extracellular solute-binding protein, family 3 precursor [Hydrogenobacter thermophilus TK-6]